MSNTINQYHDKNSNLQFLELDKANIVIRMAEHSNSVWFTMMYDAKCFQLDIEFNSQAEMHNFFRSKAEEKAKALYEIFVN